MVTMTEMQLLWAWFRSRGERLTRERDRGDGILVWVIMTAILTAAAIAIVAIIVLKATQRANDTQTQ